MSRAGFVITALAAATGISLIAFYMTKEDAPDESSHIVDASAVDARIDARAAAQKGKPAKPKPTKKRVAQGSSRPARPAPPPAARPTAAAPAGDDPAPESHAAPTAHHPPRHHAAPHGASYEAALNSNNEHMNMGEKAGPDLTDAQLAGPLRDGSFINDCEAPDDMSVTVKVAIRSGHAVGVTVSTEPWVADIAHCIDAHVRKMSWPSSPKMDSFITSY